jgi:hypothetical protein
VTGAAKAKADIETKEIAAMVTISVIANQLEKFTFSCTGEVFALDQDLLMGDPVGSTHSHHSSSSSSLQSLTPWGPPSAPDFDKSM